MIQLTYLFNIVLGVLLIVDMKKIIKHLHFGKEEIKLFLFADDIIAYVKYPRNWQQQKNF